MNESTILAETLLRIGSRPDARFFRNNSGALRDSTGRLIRYGLVGSADILGVLCVQGLGVAVGIECKSQTGKQTKQQRAFQAALTRMGGIYILARSADQAEQELNQHAARIAATLGSNQ
jgi:hypothetical protein